MITDRSLPGRLLAGGAAAVAGLLLLPASGASPGTLPGGADDETASAVAPDGAMDGATDRLGRFLAARPPDSLEAATALSMIRRAVELMEEGRTGAADDSLAAAGEVLEAARDWIGLGRARVAAVEGDTLRVRRLLAGMDSIPSERWARSIGVTALDSAGSPGSAAREALAWADAADSRAVRSRALLRAGRLFEAAGEDGRARDALRRAAGSSPWRDPALEAAEELAGRSELSAAEELAVGRAFAAHGEWDRAHPALERYLAATTDDSASDRGDVRLEHGRALYRADRYLQSIRVAESLREDLPDRAPEALLLEARGRLEYGGEADGVELLREVARRYPEHPAAGEALAELASRAEDEGRRDAARRLWVRAAGHASSAETAELRLVRSASLAYMAGDHDSAAALFEDRSRVAASASARQRSLYWAGLSRRAAGSDVESRELLRAALQVDRFSYYGTRAADLLGRPLLPEDLPTGPRTPGDLDRERTNAILRLRVAKALSLDGTVETEADRLDDHFRRHEMGRYALAEAMNEGGFPIRGVRLAHRIRLRGGDTNLRLLRALYPFPYREDIRRVASRQGLSPFVVAGLIRQESLFEAEIESSAGAIGLMQIMPSTGRDLARDHDLVDFRTDDLRRPSVNLRLGAGYLTELIDRFDGTLAFALAAYNAGPGRMSRWSRRDYAKNLDVFIEGIPFRQTRHYVKAVQAHARVYASLYGCGGSGADRYAPCLGRQASLELRPSRRPASGLSRQ